MLTRRGKYLISVSLLGRKILSDTRLCILSLKSHTPVKLVQVDGFVALQSAALALVKYLNPLKNSSVLHFCGDEYGLVITYFESSSGETSSTTLCDFINIQMDKITGLHLLTQHRSTTKQNSV